MNLIQALTAHRDDCRAAAEAAERAAMSDGPASALLDAIQAGVDDQKISTSTAVSAWNAALHARDWAATSLDAAEEALAEARGAARL